MPQAFPVWSPAANALAFQAAAAALQESVGRGNLSAQELMMAHWAAAAATAVHAAIPPATLSNDVMQAHSMVSASGDVAATSFAPNAPAFLPQPAPSRKVDLQSIGQSRTPDDLAIAELDEAVNRLLLSADDSAVGEVPSTPPPLGQDSHSLGGTPAKVSLSQVREESPAPPPGLAKQIFGDDVLSPPVILELSSMAFARSDDKLKVGLPSVAQSEEPLLLAAPPGIIDAKEQEAGAFLLDLLKAGSPTTSATVPGSATAGNTAEAISNSGRRPTRRGRRAGHTRY
jgi:hypothetical protein